MQRVSLLVTFRCEGIFLSWQKFHHFILPKPDFAHAIPCMKMIRIMKAAICYEFGKPLVIEDVVLNSPQSVDVPKLVALYQDGRFKLEELITKRYPLEELNEAVSAVKRGEALRNVIVFKNLVVVCGG